MDIGEAGLSPVTPTFMSTYPRRSAPRLDGVPIDVVEVANEAVVGRAETHSQGDDAPPGSIAPAVAVCYCRLKSMRLAGLVARVQETLQESTLPFDLDAIYLSRAAASIRARVRKEGPDWRE